MKNLKMTVTTVDGVVRVNANRKWVLSVLLVAILCVAGAAPAHAKTEVCEVTLYGDTGDSVDTGTGDDFYGQDNWIWCNDSWLLSRAKGFGMVRKSWLNAGWSDACNTDMPVGRFMAGTVALETAARNADQAAKDSILGWGFTWAWNAIDNLKLACAGKKARNAYTGANGKVKVYVPHYFYSKVRDDGTIATRTAPLRAATLIHETRHIKGKTHKAGSGGKDRRFDGKGAWSYHAIWLGWYALSANPAPKGQRCRAEQFANSILRNNFLEATTVEYRFGACEP